MKVLGDGIRIRIRIHLLDLPHKIICDQVRRRVASSKMSSATLTSTGHWLKWTLCGCATAFAHPSTIPLGTDLAERASQPSDQKRSSLASKK